MELWESKGLSHEIYTWEYKLGYNIVLTFQSYLKLFKYNWQKHIWGEYF